MRMNTTRMTRRKRPKFVMQMMKPRMEKATKTEMKRMKSSLRKRPRRLGVRRQKR